MFNGKIKAGKGGDRYRGGQRRQRLVNPPLTLLQRQRGGTPLQGTIDDHSIPSVHLNAPPVGRSFGLGAQNLHPSEYPHLFSDKPGRQPVGHLEEVYNVWPTVKSYREHNYRMTQRKAGTTWNVHWNQLGTYARLQAITSFVLQHVFGCNSRPYRSQPLTSDQLSDVCFTELRRIHHNLGRDISASMDYLVGRYFTWGVPTVGRYFGMHKTIITQILSCQNLGNHRFSLTWHRLMPYIVYKLLESQPYNFHGFAVPNPGDVIQEEEAKELERYRGTLMRPWRPAIVPTLSSSVPSTARLDIPLVFPNSTPSGNRSTRRSQTHRSASFKRRYYNEPTNIPASGSQPPALEPHRLKRKSKRHCSDPGTERQHTRPDLPRNPCNSAPSSPTRPVSELPSLRPRRPLDLLGKVASLMRDIAIVQEQLRTQHLDQRDEENLARIQPGYLQPTPAVRSNPPCPAPSLNADTARRIQGGPYARTSPFCNACQVAFGEGTTRSEHFRRCPLLDLRNASPAQDTSSNERPPLPAGSSISSSYRFSSQSYLHPSLRADDSDDSEEEEVEGKADPTRRGSPSVLATTRILPAGSDKSEHDPSPKRHRPEPMDATTESDEKVNLDQPQVTRHPSPNRPFWMKEPEVCNYDMTKLRRKCEGLTKYSGILDNVIIDVQGNICSGKSTLCSDLKRHLESYTSDNDITSSVYIFPEEPNPELLKMFYEDPNKYAFAFQTYMHTHGVHVAQQAEHLPVNSVFIDRGVWGSTLFLAAMREAKTIDKDAVKFCMAILDNLPRLDSRIRDVAISSKVMLYLDVDPKVAHKRLQKRGDTAETEVPLAYLEQLDRIHFEHLVQWAGDRTGGPHCDINVEHCPPLCVVLQPGGRHPTVEDIATKLDAIFQHRAPVPTVTFVREISDCRQTGYDQKDATLITKQTDLTQWLVTWKDTDSKANVKDTLWINWNLTHDRPYRELVFTHLAFGCDIVFYDPLEQRETNRQVRPWSLSVEPNLDSNRVPHSPTCKLRNGTASVSTELKHTQIPFRGRPRGIDNTMRPDRSLSVLPTSEKRRQPRPDLAHVTTGPRTGARTRADSSRGNSTNLPIASTADTSKEVDTGRRTKRSEPDEEI